jgi:hypothetical protein
MSSKALTQIKLRELERQRDRLHQHYAAVEERANQASEPLQRLQALYDGLRAARFAQTPLHPDVANLDAVLFQARAGRAEPELIDGWIKRLEQELARGRMRAEVAHVFGQLLAESPDPPPPGGEPPAAGKEPWAVFQEDDPPGVDPSLLLDEVLGGQNSAFTSLRQQIQTFGVQGSLAPASDDEVTALLSGLARDVYRTPELRRKASTTLGNATLVHEYAGGLTILVNNLSEWDWPADGVALRAVWTRNKWRPYLDEDLLTLLFLQLVGLRWGMLIKNQWAGFGLGGWPASVLRPPPSLQEHQVSLERVRLQHAGNLFLTRVPKTLREWIGSGYGGGGGYGEGGRDQPDALERLLALVAAEVRFRRAIQPNDPLYVVQTDLRDFYLRIPHRVLHALVEKLGFPQAWRDFIRRFLEVRLAGKGSVRRGVTLDHLLGAILAELLLLMLDVHVYQSTGVRLLRVVDDIYFLTHTHALAVQVWQAIERFCRACGLEPNEAKSGAVCLGGGSLEGLPRGLPRWGMLCLHPDGVWRYDEEAVQRLHKRMRADAEAIPSVLGMTARTSDYLGYLLRNLGVRVALERAHLGDVGRRVGQLYGELFGPGHGVVEEVRRRIETRFLDARLRQRGFPEALLYWPILAGGLSLTHPLVHLTAFQSARTSLAEQAAPQQTFDRRTSQEWLNYYTACIRTLAPKKPDSTPAMERLLADFIARGTKVKGRKQVGLSAYWQWIVYTYGPQLLDELGTFRFLLTELVPLGLIHQHRSGVRLFGGEEGSAQPASPPVPLPDTGEEGIPF